MIYKSWLVALVLAVTAPDAACDCESVTQKVGGEGEGEWEVVGCLLGCDDPQHTCDSTTLNASSGNTWTACLCNGDWSLQNCSAAVVQMPNGDTDSLCLRGGCTTCDEFNYATPDRPLKKCFVWDVRAGVRVGPRGNAGESVDSSRLRRGSTRARVRAARADDFFNGLLRVILAASATASEVVASASTFGRVREPKGSLTLSHLAGVRVMDDSSSLREHRRPGGP